MSKIKTKSTPHTPDQPVDAGATIQALAGFVKQVIVTDSDEPKRSHKPLAIPYTADMYIHTIEYFNAYVETSGLSMPEVISRAAMLLDDDAADLLAEGIGLGPCKTCGR